MTDAKKDKCRDLLREAIGAGWEATEQDTNPYEKGTWEATMFEIGKIMSQGGQSKNDA